MTMSKVTVNAMKGWAKPPLGKGLGVILVMWLVIFGVDAMTRLKLSADLTQQAYEVNELPAVSSAPNLGKVAYSAYLAKLHNFSEPAVPAKEVASESQGISEAQDSLRGSAVGLKLGEHRYRLVAIFREDDRFAVLEQLSDKGGVAGLIKGRLGDELGGFNIAAISDNFLELKNSVGTSVRMTVFEYNVADSKRVGD
jgi:hypothetical protein